jgi:hypothetical protein
MNIGDTFYSLVDDIPCYSVEELKAGRKYKINELSVNTLNDDYGFDDAVTPFLFKIPMQKFIAIAEERVVCLGIEYVITHLKCTHYDDGHDGVFGIGSSPSIDRDFEVYLGFETSQISTTKPQDFKGGTATSNDKPLTKTPAVGGSNGSGSGTPETDKKTSTGLIVGLSALGLAIFGGLIYLVTRNR